MRVSVESLSSNTTTKEHFKNWNTKPPIRGYNEHPSYAGESERLFIYKTTAFAYIFVIYNSDKMWYLLLSGSAIIACDHD